MFAFIGIVGIVFNACSNQNPRPLSEKEINGVVEKDAQETCEEIKTDDKFEDFFNNFTKDLETQLDLINDPLISHYIYPDEEWNTVIEEESTDKETLKKNWKFLTAEYFIESDNEEEEYFGKWNKKSDNIMEFRRGINHSGFYEEFVFKKVDNKWAFCEYTLHSF
jgi:hypothetical protein